MVLFPNPRWLLVGLLAAFVLRAQPASEPGKGGQPREPREVARPGQKLEDLRQSQPEDYRVYTEHPRLLLNPRRLRLLRRERERKTLRWEQFQLLVSGKADLPEKGFAWALYSITAEDAAVGKQAIQWALGPGADLRQLALVYDWCHHLLDPAQARALENKLLKGLEREQRQSVSAVRDKVLAAVALVDHVAQVPEKTLQEIFQAWWLNRMVPAILQDRSALALSDGYPLIELMHVVQDNLKFDMRDNARPFFKDFPAHRLISYYPAVYPAAENQYHIPMYRGLGEPDLQQAALSRAADLALVAFDTNALEHQFLQGWLMQDRFIMRSPFGAPYEFLWANQYQPGLSYHHMTKQFHDPKAGLLILRSSWEEDAIWLSYHRGEMELFMDGKRSGLRPRAIQEPLQIGDAVVMVGEDTMRFSLTFSEATKYFILGLRPHSRYDLEVDDEEIREVRTDAGGILALSFPPSAGIGARLHYVGPLPPALEPSSSSSGSGSGSVSPAKRGPTTPGD
ncbi:MAG: hypothetical protein NZV14_03220 [Bryobacteraceae bacterium]|nr:hypothetical protein [Bryobacteraceae bacterium]MDW8377146.1 hypothetical protein [Bryobacterales bacterium]